MKISTRGRYGVRLLMDLALHQGEDHVALEKVAERQDISVRYLEQVVIIMRRAGFFRSVKGAFGGYALAQQPGDIIIGDVLRVLEGDMLITDPPLPDRKESKLQRCIRLTVFDRLNDRIANVIDKKTLASVLGATGPGGAFMYFI